MMTAMMPRTAQVRRLKRPTGTSPIRPEGVACRLPRSWDRFEPSFATVMGPPGLAVMGPPACRAPVRSRLAASDHVTGVDVEVAGGVSGGSGERGCRGAALLAGPVPAFEVATAKIVCAMSAQSVTAAAHQIHGAIGVTRGSASSMVGVATSRSAIASTDRTSSSSVMTCCTPSPSTPTVTDPGRTSGRDHLVVTTGSCSGVVGDQMDASQGGGGGPYRCCTADDDNAARRHLSPDRPRTRWTNFRS